MSIQGQPCTGFLQRCEERWQTVCCGITQPQCITDNYLIGMCAINCDDLAMLPSNVGEATANIWIRANQRKQHVPCRQLHGTIRGEQFLPTDMATRCRHNIRTTRRYDSRTQLSYLHISCCSNGGGRLSFVDMFED